MSERIVKRSALLVLVVLVASSCAEKPVVPPPAGTPRLVVLISVDQMRGEFIDRFDQFWTGGFRYLLDHSLRFTDAHQDHAITATAPGHASLATGCHPSRHGIYSNYWIDRESGELVYSGADDDWVASPFRLECDSLGDWLKARYRTARVFSVSGKDRSAVLMGGHHPDGVFFYDDDNGSWQSSEFYYRQGEPEWVDAFNAERRLDARFGQPWTVLPVSEEELAAVGVEPFELGPLEPDLPISFGGLSPAPGASFYDDLFASPWLDEHMARFAEQLIGAEALGGDEFPDLLALGFSATDAVGHAYGPDSPQLLDTLRRLDVTLGELFDFLDRRVGLENVVIALTADHGSVSVPELRQANGLSGRRMGDEDVLCMQRVYQRLQGRFGEGAWLLPGPFVNREALAASDVGYEQVERVAAELIAGCPSVEAIWTRSELTTEAAASDAMGRLFANSFHPERAPDFMILRDEFFLTTRAVGTSHGTAWRYDTHVPLMIAGDAISSGQRDQRVRTVDLAPSLAALLAVEPTAEIDGTNLELMSP